jgi:succinate dehydrogenase / fumarate reductase cytochrome b subunit
VQETVREPVTKKPPRRPIAAWFDVRSRGIGSTAFALNRLTGIGLTVYLYLHLWALSLLLAGEAEWNAFVAQARTTPFLLLDVVLIFGLLFHGLNGIRLAILSKGIATRFQREMLYALLAIGAALLVVATVLVFTK